MRARVCDCIPFVMMLTFCVYAAAIQRMIYRFVCPIQYIAIGWFRVCLCVCPRAFKQYLFYRNRKKSSDINNQHISRPWMEKGWSKRIATIANVIANRLELSLFFWIRYSVSNIFSWWFPYDLRYNTLFTISINCVALRCAVNIIALDDLEERKKIAPSTVRGRH